MSRMLRALSIMGAGLGGYATGQRQFKEDQRREEDQAWQREDREYMRRKRQEDTDLQDSLKVAARPAAIEEVAAAKPETMDNRDVGQPGEQPVTPTFKVGMSTFADRAAAEQAANDPRASMQRMASAYLSKGRPIEAAQLRSTTRQDEAAEMQIEELRNKKLNDAYNARVFSEVQDFPTLAKFINASKGDGEGGKLQVDFKPTADGKKMVMYRLGTDGAMTPVREFDNNDSGWQTAVGLIGMRLSPQEKWAHMKAVARDAAELKKWESEFGIKERQVANQEQATRQSGEYQQGMLGVARKNADTNAKRWPPGSGSRGGNTPETRVLGQMLQSVKEQRLDVERRKGIVTDEYKAEIRNASKGERAEARARYDAKMKVLEEEDKGYRAKYAEIDKRLGFVGSDDDSAEDQGTRPPLESFQR